MQETMPQKYNNGAARLAALFFLLMTGCASFDTTIPDAWDSPIELTETPFHPQLEHHCGPAALITVLEASGATPGYDEVVDRIYVPGLEGSLQVELLAATRSFDRIPFRLPGELQPVLAEVEAGRPVLILQNLGLPVRPAWHYAVVIGYDRDRAEVLMRSGTDPLLATPTRRWMRQWDWASRWAIVVLEPGDLPTDPHLPAVLRALADFDDRGPAESRLRAWRAAAAQWPTEPLAWMGMGNAHYELGDLVSAATDFQYALEFNPDSWPARLNLAQVLLEANHPCQSQTALASQPMPLDHPLLSIHGRLSTQAGAACAASAPGLESGQAGL